MLRGIWLFISDIPSHELELLDKLHYKLPVGLTDEASGLVWLKITRRYYFKLSRLFGMNGVICIKGDD